MKVLITAGGGGHFSPAYSIFQHAPKDWEILIVGRKYGLEGDSSLSFEYRLAREENLPFVVLSTGRLQRRFSRHTIPSLLKIPYGFIQALIILTKFRPDVSLLFGGYISFPVAICSLFFAVPIVIHEQTQEAGLANKIISFFAKKVLISWESSRAFFPKNKVVLTGNPIRKELYEKPPVNNLQDRFDISTEELPLIYITGGSVGSHTINILVEGCLDKLLTNFRLIHQTGETKNFRDFERLVKRRNSLPENLKKRYIVAQFIEPKDLSIIFRFCDAVVSRAGINTISELLHHCKPSLLIPLSFSQKNEQVKNAKFLASLGLSQVILEKNLTSNLFFEKVADFVANIKKYQNCEKAKNIVKKDAAQAVISELNKIHNEKNKV